MYGRFSLITLQLLLSTVTPGHSQNFSQPLNFPAELNGAVIASPKIDYEILSANSILLNNQLTSCRDFIFTPDHDRLTIGWPATMLQNGTLLFYNSNAQVLTTITLNSKDIELQRSDQALTANITIANLTTRAINDIAYFCLKKELQDQYIKLCSPIIPISLPTNEAHSNTKNHHLKFLINQYLATTSGTIYFNKRDLMKLTINFACGASLDILTRAPVYFINDIILDPNTQQAELTISADNITNTNVKKVMTPIYAEKSILSIPTPLGITFMQELFFTTTLPTANDRIFLANDAYFKTYAATLDFVATSHNPLTPLSLTAVSDMSFPMAITNPHNTTAIAHNDSPLSISKSHIENISSNQLHWHITDLKKGKWQSALIKRQEHTMVQPIYRGFSSKLAILTSSIGKNLFSKIYYHHWFEGYQSIGRQQLGLQLDNTTPLSDTKEFKFSINRIAVNYRFLPGLTNVDETFGCLINYQQITRTDTYKLGGMGFFAELKLPQTLKELLLFLHYPTWLWLELDYYPFGLDNISINKALVFMLNAKMFISNAFFIQVGVHLQDFDLTATRKLRFTNYATDIGCGINF